MARTSRARDLLRNGHLLDQRAAVAVALDGAAVGQLALLSTCLLLLLQIVGYLLLLLLEILPANASSTDVVAGQGAHRAFTVFRRHGW